MDPATGVPSGQVPVLELLETRVLLSAVSLSGGTWVILGDGDPEAPDDRIVVRVSADDPGMLEIELNGAVVDRQAIDVIRRVRVKAGQGDDSVLIELNDVDLLGRAIPAVVYGGPGDDSLIGGAGNDRLVGGDGDDSIEGGDGQDRRIDGEGALYHEGVL